MHHVRLVALFSPIFFGTLITLVQLFDWDVDMHFILPFVLSSVAVAQNVSVDLKWYAPKKSWINDLRLVLNGTGTNGFVFNGSQTPAGSTYGGYNWCNMPHVRKQEYPRVKEEFELVYVEV
jgi:hypothetical protein